MNAKEAAAKVRKLEAKERAEAAVVEKARVTREKSRVSNASRSAKKWFEGSVTEAITKAVEDKCRQTVIPVYPNSEGGKAEIRALQKILRANGYTVSDEASYSEDIGHDPDWGHYDHSYHYLTASW